MDKFALIIGIVGVILLIISIIIIISVIVRVIKKKGRLKGLLFSLTGFLIIFAFATSFIYLSLFLQTFSRYIHEEKIGWVYTEKMGDMIKVYFCNEKEKEAHSFELYGDQWMVEGYILRWKLYLRWLGANSYYRVTRFRGRWEILGGEISPTEYEIHPHEDFWKFLLKNAEHIPLVDAAYGIGAFQYPARDTFYLYINDTGFILRKH